MEYGMMLRPRRHAGLALLIFSLCIYAGLPDQKPTGAINDFAGILSRGVKDSLELLSGSLFRKTGAALALVTVQSLDGEDIDGAANRLFSKWGIGAKGKDEGILILLALKERELRIETGYGAEGYLTDVQSKRIIRDIATPFLSKGQWDRGLGAAVAACAELAARAHSVDISEVSGYSASAGAVDVPGFRRYKPNALTIIIGALLLLFLVGTRGGRSVLMLLLLSFLTSGGRGGYRSSGFGGGNGGFGGFGGGMSGGGGASGRF
jgi:uncharacterized protein